ncbi:hypothetical protein [Psychrobacter urativorans]|uniref:hypothetical protein n=1 Tax=Psychrobacter urativorans TaxID=45610 RepID=UPI00191B4F74|nr:hypothetical protein [Psychrobacter urativorans]
MCVSALPPAIATSATSAAIIVLVIRLLVKKLIWLEAAAGKGEILINQSTYDYICYDYECAYAGAFSLKGFDKINAWQVFDSDANKGQLSRRVDHTLPGFNLHLNFKDMKNYCYP